MEEREREQGESAAPLSPDQQGRTHVSKQLYEEIQQQYRLHDTANENLEKKAQNLMIASALVAALFASLTSAHEAGQLLWGPSGLYMAVVHTAGMVLAIVFCIRANWPASHPVPIAGGGLLRDGSLDEKTYASLILDEKSYHKSRIGEYAQDLIKLEGTNEKKARRLKCAYVSFGVSVAAIGAGFGIALLL